MILNLETFGAPTMIGRSAFESLLLMLAQRDVGAVRVDGLNMPYVEQMFRQYRGAAATALLRRFIRRLSVCTDAFGGYTVVPKGQIRALPAACMAIASKTASVSLGLPDSAYQNDFSYNVDPDSFTSLMVTTDRHLKTGDFRRWLFLRRFRDGEDYKSYLSIASSSQNKHFSADLASLPMCSSHQWNRSWINATRGGKGHDAKFMPGLRFGSVEYYYLVYLALRAAYFAGRFTTQEQKALTVELHAPIGAAGGKIVTKIRFYCTSSNTVHIRPDERQDFDVELKKSYVPGLHEFNMEFGLGKR